MILDKAYFSYTKKTVQLREVNLQKRMALDTLTAAQGGTFLPGQQGTAIIISYLHITDS